MASPKLPPFRSWHVRVTTVWIMASIIVPIIEGVFGWPHWFLNTIRAVTLVEACIIFLITILIARRYWANYRAAPRSSRLLPSHVYRFSLGTALITVGASGAVIDAIDKDFIWYVTPIIFPAFTIMLSGLIDMIRWLPYRQISAGTSDIEGFRRAVNEVNGE